MLELNGQMRATYGFLFDDTDLADLNAVLEDKGFEKTNYDEIAKVWGESTQKGYDINSKEYRIISFLEWNYASDCQLEYADDDKRTSNPF